MTSHQTSGHLIVTKVGRLLLTAGVVEVAVGLLHFAMPYFAQQSPGLAALNSAEDDFFVLVTLATGILLIASGAFTLAFASDPGDHPDLLYRFLIIKTVLWGARLALEVLYPARLDMFGIEPFTMIASPGMVAEFGVFAYATFLCRQLKPRLG